jgi:hypothetical protein
MAGIKVGAHPMVVAVAMGLLGPGALLDESPRAERAGTTAPEPDQAPVEAEQVSAEEFARVESLWHEVRVRG